MNKIITVLLFLGLILPGMTMAQTPPNNQPSVDVRQNIRVGREAMIETRLQMMGAKVALRLTAALARAENLIKRVEVRLALVASTDRFDKNLVNQKLVEAKAAIERGKITVGKITVEVEAALAEPDLNLAFDEVRTLLRSAMNDVKIAHQKIVEAIILIRGGTTGPTPTPSN